MKSRRRLLLAVALVTILALGALALYAWNAFQAPLYEPGMLRAGRNLRAPLEPPAQPAGGDFWTVESDIRLYHFADGQGPNVLVVHGGPGIPFAQPPPGLQALADRFRFVYYDQRGSGRSTRPIDRFASGDYFANVQTLDRTLGLGAQLADIERIRRLLGGDPIILAGHSWGGFLAALYAAEFPENVRALVLIAPADVLVFPPADGGLYGQVGRRLPDDLQAGFADYQKRLFDYGGLFARSESDLAALNAEFERYYAVAAERQGFAVPPAAPGATGGWMAQAQYFSMGQRHDYRAALGAVRAPTLVVHGANDLQPELASRSYAEAIPDAQFTTIPGAGHFPFDDQPEAFARTVADFLATLPQPR